VALSAQLCYIPCHARRPPTTRISGTSLLTNASHEEILMSRLPSQAHVVVIGAGIVGNSLVYHLARLGWKDIVQIDKGPLPNPGGSTGHASNFIFLVDHAREITQFTLDSVAQYKALGVFTQSGGIEIARTSERHEELKRRLASAKAWGVDSELISPPRIKALVPYINEKILVSGFHTPGVGTVDALRAGTLMRERAQTMIALQSYANVEVTGIDVDPQHGRVVGVRTDQGDIRCEVVVIACGVWSPRIARLVGASIPLTPTVHQMIRVGPVPLFEKTIGEIQYPLVRDMDGIGYERQHGSDLEIGSYTHRAMFVYPDEIPSIQQARLSPTEMPFTKEDFDPYLERARDLMPEILSDPRVGIRYAINGLLSLTPDGYPCLGETPEVKNLWTMAHIWVKEAPAFARTLAEWMTTGAPELDPTASDISRFYDHQKTWVHVRGRAAEGFAKFYGIVHPREQWASDRPARLSPLYERQKALGAVFFETVGWERPHWYEANAGLLDKYADRARPRENEWDARWWSPIITAEHLALRESVGMVDLTGFGLFDLTGPGALDCVQRMAVAQMDVPVGRVIYTQLLNPAGGIKSDLTITRLGANHFRITTAAFDGRRDKKWLVDHLPADGSVHLADLTAQWATVCVWGPNARALVQSCTDADLSNAAFPFASCRAVDFGSIRTLASRFSYVGELGWEIYVPFEHSIRLWDKLWEAGQPYRVVPVGLGVVGTTARLEKGYRAYGNELSLEWNLVEAGLSRPRVKPQDFIGKTAFLKQRAETPTAKLCTLTVDAHTSSSGMMRFMLGREPILTRQGQPITDARGRRSYVTSAGFGASVGKHLLMAYLPPECAQIGTPLVVEYFAEQYPVTVAAVGAQPLFDPKNERPKA
jgi:glycine cleavage system aminomethyltransferase T/glycine/D-amino acid oxidase-like deaminating enzyme